MKLKTLRLATGLALTAAAGISQAASFPIVDARVAGMGGVAVATANLDSAAYYNPALLAAQESSSDFSFSFSGGVNVADPDNLIGASSDFTNSLSTFSTITPAQYAADPSVVQTDFNNLQTTVSNLSGKSFTGDLNGGINTGFTLGKWAAAVTAQKIYNAGFNFTAQDGTPNIIDTSTNTTLTWSQIQSNPALLQNVGTDAQLQLTGVQGTEVGLSLARKMTIAGLDMSIGFTPKLLSLASGTSTQALTDAGTLPNFPTGNATSNFNMDAGIVWKASDNLRVAGTVLNLMDQKYGSYEVKPQARAGIGYATELLTVGADMDLTENDNFGTKSRILAVGAEFNAWYAMQFRLGYRNDLSSHLTQYSAGIGILNSAVNAALIVNPQNMSQGVSAYIGFGINF